MKLNHNSISAKLYRWVYATKKMPENLCPYFWKLVLMWVQLIPYTLLSLPYVVLKGKDRGGSWGEKPGTGTILYFVLGLIASMLWSLTLFFYVAPKDSFAQNMQILGFLLWILAIVFGGWELIKWSIEKYKDSKIKYDADGYRIWEPVKEKEPNIIVEWVKATYHQYCPKIEWQNKDKK